MSFRGSSIQTTLTTSVVVPLPAGSAAGDLAILFSAGFAPTLPSGWTSLYSESGTWSLFAASKVLSSGDISAGNIPISFAGAFDGVGAIAVFVGAAGGVRETQGNVGGSSTPITLTTSGAVQSTDTGIYFATLRGTSPALPTITPGSGSATTLQHAGTANGNSLLANQAQPGGALSVVYGYAAASPSVAVQVIVEIGLAPPGTLLVNPGTAGGMDQLYGGMNG